MHVAMVLVAPAVHIIPASLLVVAVGWTVRSMQVPVHCPAGQYSIAQSFLTSMWCGLPKDDLASPPYRPFYLNACGVYVSSYMSN
ncbi:hypothetical protein HOY82DRAFT_569738 [Tuber indicum]|nr:hypothetical protein HOY82DRAFT_569738 [Tuber indicum]